MTTNSVSLFVFNSYLLKKKLNRKELFIKISIYLSFGSTCEEHNPEKTFKVL